MIEIGFIDVGVAAVLPKRSYVVIAGVRIGNRAMIIQFKRTVLQKIIGY